MEKTNKQEKRLSATIDEEINSFKGKIYISDSKTFDHYDTINRINNYRNDEFHENAEDGAIFWNLAKPRVPHFVKKLKFKARHFRMAATGEKNVVKSWIANLKFQQWCRETGFSLDLEDLKTGIAEFGSQVMKLVDKGSAETIEGEIIDKYNTKKCLFSKLYYDTASDNIVESTIIEEHEMTELQLRAKNGIWDNEGKNTIKKALKNGTKVEGTSADNVITKWKIYERWGDRKEIEPGQNDEDVEAKYMHEFVTGQGDKEVVLYSEEKERKDCSYVDFHLSGYDGRHLREGIYERLFKLEARANQLVNENAQASAIASLLLFKSSEDDLTGVNLIQRAISGQVIDTRDLEQIGIDNRFLQNFLSELMIIERQADKLCLVGELSTGNLPADASVRGQIMATNEIDSAFKPIRTRIGTKMAKVLMEKIMPGEMAEWKDEHIIDIANNEIDIRMYDYYMINAELEKFIKSQFALGKNPGEEEKKLFLDKLLTKFNVEGRRLPVPKNFYNFKVGITMDPTGENENKEQMNGIYQYAIDRSEANPQIANHPLFREYLERNGLTPFKLTPMEVNELSAGRQGGQSGGVTPKRDKLLSEVKNEQ